MNGKAWKILTATGDVDDRIEGFVRETVHWFVDEQRLNTQDFIDKLCGIYGGSGYDPLDFDIADYASPAVRKIMRIARELHQEQRQ